MTLILRVPSLDLPSEYRFELSYLLHIKKLEHGAYSNAFEMLPRNQWPETNADQWIEGRVSLLCSKAPKGEIHVKCIKIGEIIEA